MHEALFAGSCSFLRCGRCAGQPSLTLTSVAVPGWAAANQPILHLIQSIRDEAHRYAVTFHRSRRNAQRLVSKLDQIKGVGAKTLQKLLKYFGSSRWFATRSEELARLVGPAARKVREFYAPPVDAPSGSEMPSRAIRLTHI